jgi:ATP-dependent DNA helicase RecG
MKHKLTVLDRESKTIEYKRELSANLSNIIKTCVAFANTAGGKILIGVEDKTRAIIGLSEIMLNRALESIPTAVYQAVTPPLIPEVYSQRINDKEVVVVEVLKGNNPPYYVKSQGSTKGAYIRVGPTTRAATKEHLIELINLKSLISFESEATKMHLEALDSKLLQDAFGRSPSQNTLISEKVLIASDRRNMVVSKAALIAFGHAPQEAIPEAGMICTRFKGTSGRDIVETYEIDGPTPDLVNKALMFLERHLENNLQVKGSRLQGQFPIPPEALREAVINAVVHRKYQVPSRCKIAVFDDRVEIFSPGGLPGLVTVSNLGDGISHLRNPILARFARRLRLVEKLGSGVRLMIDSCTKAGISPPQFYEEGDYVKVIFSYEKVKDPFMDISHILDQLFNTLDKVRIRDVLQLASASRNTVTNTLNKMIKEKKVERFGRGAGVYYTRRRKK